MYIPGIDVFPLPGKTILYVPLEFALDSFFLASDKSSLSA